MADAATQWQDRHERRDVPRRGLLLFAAAFVLFLVVASAILWVAYGLNTSSFAAAQSLGEVPNDTELYQRNQLAAYRAAQSAELARLGWSDGSKRFAKVPIGDAMKLLAAKGTAR